MIEPVAVYSAAEVVAIAEEMKAYAKSHFHENKPEYSKSDEELREWMNNEDFRKVVAESPGIRCLLLRGELPVTLGLTLDLFKDPISWNLSMSIPIPSPGQMVQRVPDEIVKLLVPCFFGNEYTEIPPEGRIKEIRQFIKPLERMEKKDGEGDNNH
jgi:hypothetical protein